jgi:enoyl-CoA hydratase
VAPEADLDDAVEHLAQRMASVPCNQLIMQKMMVNQALENMGMASTQTLATIFDGISRHSPEGVNFKRRSDAIRWKQTVKERDEGSFDWTSNCPFDDAGSENKE